MQGKMKMASNRGFQCLTLLLAVGLLGCQSTERIVNQNLAYIYDTKTAVLQPEFRVRHENDSVSLIDMYVRSSDLLYVFNPGSGYHSAEFRLRYEVYGQLESRIVLDSAVVLFKDSILELSNRSIETTLQLRPSISPVALLKLDMVDLKGNTRFRRYINVDRSDKNASQYFKVQDADGHPVFINYLEANERVTIIHASGSQQAKVRYYRAEFPLPKPPFSMEDPTPFSYKADSIFLIDLGTPVNFAKEGMYHIQMTDSGRLGLTLFRFRDGFPKVRHVDDLIAPLRYINSSQEFKKLTSADFPKAEVDRFWLSLAGNSDRARILIEKFYGRVQDANTFFSSFTEGWRTDRGMIFLIFGPPTTLYKGSNAEQWTYGEPSSPSSVSFTFIKVNNPFTDNDFRLERSQLYKSNWFRAVDMWRQGRIYLEN